MKLFRTASLGDWVALALFIGTITLALVRASTKASVAITGIARHEVSISQIHSRLDSVEDTVLTLKLTNSSEHKALNKTANDTYTVVKLLAEQQGIIVP